MAGGKLKEGNIKFYYSKGDDEKLEQLRGMLGWDFENPKKTKELNLTHNLIAPKAGFANLMAIYDGDKIIEYSPTWKERPLFQRNTKSKVLNLKMSLLLWITANGINIILSTFSPIQELNPFLRGPESFFTFVAPVQGKI